MGNRNTHRNTQMKMGTEREADMNGELSSELNNHCNAQIYSMIGPSPSPVSVLTFQLELAHGSIRKLEEQVYSLQQQLSEKDDLLKLTAEKHAKARDEATQNAFVLKKHIAICEELRNEYERFRRDRDAFEEQIVEAHEKRELAEKRATEAEMRERIAQRRLEKALQASSMTHLERKRNGYLEEMLPNCVSNERVAALRSKPQTQRVMRKKIAAPLASVVSSGLIPEGKLEDERPGQPTPRKKAKSEGLDLCNESAIDRRKLSACHNDSNFHSGQVLVTSGKYKIEEKLSANDLSSMQEKLEPSVREIQN